jgi:peptide/nickel transport system substrate-binding protein
MDTTRYTPTRRMRRSSGWAGAAAVAAVALTACSSAEPATTSGEGLIIGRAMDVTTLDISRSLCDTCQIYNAAVYESLTRATEEGTLEPLLAESWEANADNTEFTFTLNTDAVFSDGSPVEAKDVVWSWLRLQNLQDAPSYFMSGITSVEAPDESTVVVTSEAPNSAFLNISSAGYMGVVNSDVAAENGATADADAASSDDAEQWFLENSAGSGQYVLDSYSEGSELALTANENYWGEEPSFTEVTIKEVTDSSAQLQQLQQGDIDVAMQISFDALDQVESDPELTTEVVPSYNFVYVAFSPGVVGAEALQDVRVRDAIRMGIDYETVIDATVAGNGEKQSTGIPNGFEGTSDLPLPEFDPEGAKALLAEAGFPNGLEVETVYPNTTTYGVNFTTMMQSIQQSLAQIGVTLNLTPVEFTNWVDRVQGDGIPFTAVYFAPDHPDTIQYVQYFSLAEASVWQERAKMPVNAEQTALSAAALSQSGEEREATYAALGQLMYDDAIILPVVNPSYLLASSSAVQGNNYDIARNLDLSRMSFSD